MRRSAISPVFAPAEAPRVRLQPCVKDLGFIGSWRKEQTIEQTGARLI
jgi:hypothetical protein